MSAETREATAYRWSRRLLIAMGMIAVLGMVGLAALLVLSPRGDPDAGAAKVETADRTQTFLIGEAAAIEGTPLIRVNISQATGSDGSYSYAQDRASIWSQAASTARGAERC